MRVISDNRLVLSSNIGTKNLSFLVICQENNVN
jgi:hypothetical protein